MEIVICSNSHLHSPEWTFKCLLSSVGLSKVRRQPGNWQLSLSVSPSSLLPASVSSDLTLEARLATLAAPGLASSDSRSEPGAGGPSSSRSLPPTVSMGWPDMRSSRVRVIVSELSPDSSLSPEEVKLMSAGRKDSDSLVAVEVSGGGVTRVPVLYEEVAALLLMGDRMRVWDTGRFSGVELSSERRVCDCVAAECEECEAARGSTNCAPATLPPAVTVRGLELAAGEAGAGAPLLLPELCRNTPTSWAEIGLLENTVLGSTRAVLDWLSPARVFTETDGDSMGSSSSPSAARMLRRFSSRLGSVSGMMVPGLEEAWLEEAWLEAAEEVGVTRR